LQGVFDSGERGEHDERSEHGGQGGRGEHGERLNVVNSGMVLNAEYDERGEVERAER
jgi:hypothetical protein